MIAADLINKNVPSLDAGEDIGQAITLMDDYKLHKLPVVDNSKFKGFITEDMLYQQQPNGYSLSLFELDEQNCFVLESQHFYDAVKMAVDCHSTMIAVLSDEDKSFTGVITTESLIDSYSATSAVQSPGSVVVLSLKSIDYSLSEISRLIESDGAKIIGSYINVHPNDPQSLLLTLKIDNRDVSRIVATLERFEYTIAAQFQEDALVSNEKERLGILMRYLNI